MIALQITVPVFCIILLVLAVICFCSATHDFRLEIGEKLKQNPALRMIAGLLAGIFFTLAAGSYLME